MRRNLPVVDKSFCLTYSQKASIRRCPNPVGAQFVPLPISLAIAFPADNSRSMKKSPSVENTVVDEARQCTYVVMAPRVLTDGEMYSAIRVEVLRRGGKLPQKGETLVITSTVA